MGNDKGLVSEHRGKITKLLDSIGLLTHEISEASLEDEALGVVIDGRNKMVSVSGKRRQEITHGVNWLLSKKRVCGREVEVIVGHLTFAFLVRRPLFAVFNTVYKFIKACYHVPTALWTSVKEELSHARNLLCVCFSKLDLCWSPTVLCFDACPSGRGIVIGHCDTQKVRQLGSVPERARFKCARASWQAREASGVLVPKEQQSLYGRVGPCAPEAHRRNVF